MKKYLPVKNSPAMTREEVRSFDRWAIEKIGIPGAVLMENAGRTCAEIIMEKLGDSGGGKVCIFCGTGNNGGDGFVIARHLLNNGFAVKAVICGEREKIKGDARLNLDVFEKLGGVISGIDMAGADIAGRVKESAAGADMLVDAVFGTGLKGRLSDEYIRLVNAINACGRMVAAVDIPSGLDCDTGEPLGAAVKADFTVTFVAAKTGFANETSPGRRYTGEVFIASIGVAICDGFRRDSR